MVDEVHGVLAATGKTDPIFVLTEPAAICTDEDIEEDVDAGGVSFGNEKI